MTDIKAIAESLGRAKSVPAGYLCRCPCHDDRESSLSLKLSKSGSLAVNCFAGCEWETVWKELRSRGLLPDREKGSGKRKEWSEIKTIYPYVDENGKELFQKIRLHNGKKGLHRHWDDAAGKWIWNMQGVRLVLYNLPKLIAAPLVYICEGEKDADSLNSRGLVATTNNAGAVSWDATFTPFFKDKTVVICEDNDDAGRRRTKKLCLELFGVAKEIRIFRPEGVKEHGDVTDWIEGGGDVTEIYKRSEAATPQETREKATRDQYFDLFDRVLGNPRKCIFSEKLMTKDPHTDLWNPAINYLDIIRSEAAVSNDEGNAPKFQLTLIQPHFFAYEATKKPEFLVDLPAWDGEPRIEFMASLVKLKDGAGVSGEAFGELLKEWCALMMRRLHDPKIQNRILVLQGHQGAGKDTWLSMLLDGLGQFAAPLSIVKESKDTFLSLHRGLVVKIAEFDKTAKAEVSMLKDLITTPTTDFRAPYDRDAKIRMSRCSFVSSANIENILRDYTGNRRFLIFEVDQIEYAYKDWSEDAIREWQMQVLAEADHLARAKFEASAEAREEMRQYIERKTPDDPAEDTFREYQAIMKRKAIELSSRPHLTEQELSEVALLIKERTGMNVRAIREQLRRRVGYYQKTPEGRRWLYLVPCADDSGSPPSENGRTATPF